MENLYPLPPPAPNQGWENGAFWLLLGFILDLVGGVGGGLLFHFILSKIVVLTEFNYPNQRNVHKTEETKICSGKTKLKLN